MISTKYSGSIEMFTITDGGTMYHVTRLFGEELLTDAGYSVHARVPHYQLIDKVGFLKTEAESLEIAGNLIIGAISQMDIGIDGTDDSQISFDFDSCDT